MDSLRERKETGRRRLCDLYLVYITAPTTRLPLSTRLRLLLRSHWLSFNRYGYSELLLGVRRAQSPQRVASADAVHVGLVAAHAVATNSSFTLSYFPR